MAWLFCRTRLLFGSLKHTHTTRFVQCTSHVTTVALDLARYETIRPKPIGFALTFYVRKCCLMYMSSQGIDASNPTKSQPVSTTFNFEFSPVYG